jgi:hypothetical protein
MCNSLFTIYRFSQRNKGTRWVTHGLNFTLLALMTYTTLAQGTFSFVLPAGSETVEGNSSSRIPFDGNPQSPTRSQQFFTPSAFPALPSEGVLLTDISFRLNVDPLPVVGQGVRNFQNIDVVLSTTTKSLSQISTIDYDGNHGPDRTVVFSGSMSFVIPAPTTTPAPFNIKITFQTPFLYRPSSGTLVTEMDVLSSTFADGMNLDAIVLSSPGSMLFLWDRANRSSMGLPLQFGYTSVPEPPAKLLLVGGMLLISLLGQPKKH